MRNVQSCAAKLFTHPRHVLDGIAKVAYFTVGNI